MKALGPMLLVLGIILLSVESGAQETSGKFGEGSVLVGADSRACSGSLEGSLRWNSGTSCMEYCDGTDWVCPDSVGGCPAAPSLCPNVGDVCNDGSIFAGFVLYNSSSCEALYVTDNNQSASIQWKTATGTNDITDPDDHVDGRYNRDNRGGGTFPAFELCENNNYHGKNDWYLPSRVELNLLWLNRAAIDANAAGNFTTQTYWASAENGTDWAWSQGFFNGNQPNNSKTNNLDVRCVRRD